MNKVAVVMGSERDWMIMQEAVKCLKELDIEHEVHVMSCHRTPDIVRCFAMMDDWDIVIAGAGMAASLSGAIAAHTVRPVIGVPLGVPNAKLGGVDALLSTVQVPSGVPVATVGINAARNAAILAAQILGMQDEKIRTKLHLQKLGLHHSVLEKNDSVRQLADQLFVKVIGTEEK